MKKQWPEKVTLFEVGPRDGFQFEPMQIPTGLKIDTIQNLIQAGIKNIQITSFVNPERVVQMADAERVIQALPHRDDLVISGLVLNGYGLERAKASGLKHVEISFSVSHTHSLKNTGMSFKKALEQAKTLIRQANEHGLIVRAGVQCAFGCVFEGGIPKKKVTAVIDELVKAEPESLALSDTTGMAHPLSIGNILESVLPRIGKTPLSLHLHDTRGLGLANLLMALDYGITEFDTALGGMGGCPFLEGASGNIATEDTVNLLESMGITTGIDMGMVAETTIKLEEFLKKRFPAKMTRILK